MVVAFRARLCVPVESTQASVEAQMQATACPAPLVVKLENMRMDVAAHLLVCVYPVTYNVEKATMQAGAKGPLQARAYHAEWCVRAGSTLWAARERSVVHAHPALQTCSTA